MKITKLVRQLRKIDKDCNKYPGLEEALKPYIDKHMTSDTVDKEVAKDFIVLYKKEKKRLYG